MTTIQIITAIYQVALALAMLGIALHYRRNRKTLKKLHEEQCQAYREEISRLRIENTNMFNQIHNVEEDESYFEKKAREHNHKRSNHAN